MNISGDCDDGLVWFVVEDDGSLSDPSFAPLTSRAELYGDISPSWSESPHDLVLEMSRCRPLAWCVHGIYENARNDISEALSDLDEESDNYQEMAAKLNRLLEQMPEEPEDNTERWLGTLDLSTFKATVVPVVDKWLSEEPDYRFEDEFIDTDASPEGSAFQFFESLDQSELNELGLSFVDGDRPGSNLRYAVLETDIAQANAVAERTRQPFRFRRR